MRAETFFPSCWDGWNVDSADHKSHVRIISMPHHHIAYLYWRIQMAFPAIGEFNTGVCPQSHPVAILSVFYEFFYDTDAIQDFNRLVWAMGDATGYGLHGDYLQGWTEQGRLERAVETCTGPNGVDDLGCSLNVGPNGPGVAAPRLPEVAPPREEVGESGALERLPGDNPVQ